MRLVSIEHSSILNSWSHISIQFNLICEENEWRLASVGAYNNIARLIFLPLSGIISDKWVHSILCNWFQLANSLCVLSRFGRRTILMIALVLSSIAGIIQSLSINYTIFIVCEIFCAILACPIFTAALILGLEWAGAQQRVVVNSIITFPLPIGVALCGIFAFYAQDFRPLLRYVYGPAMVTTLFVYFGPESFRWLMAKGKRTNIEHVLKTAAKINKCKLSPRTLEIVDRKCGVDALNKHGKLDFEATGKSSMHVLFTSWTLIFRVCINALCWITGNYVNHGINIISVSLHGDKYVNYVTMALGGLPSGFISILLLKCVGRRIGISLCFLAASVTVVVGKLLSNEYSNIALIMFLSARCFAAVAFLIVYIHTSELWPTKMRHSVMGISSTLGRVGAILAPLAPLLVRLIMTFYDHVDWYTTCFFRDSTVEYSGDPTIPNFWRDVHDYWIAGAALTRNVQWTSSRYDRRCKKFRKKP